jgi:hypothetical protein
MSNLHQEFANEQFLRYAAECVRLASLAGRSGKMASQRKPMRRLSRQRISWLRQMWDRIRHSPKRYSGLATNH